MVRLTRPQLREAFSDPGAIAAMEQLASDVDSLINTGTSSGSSNVVSSDIQVGALAARVEELTGIVKNILSYLEASPNIYVADMAYQDPSTVNISGGSIVSDTLATKQTTVVASSTNTLTNYSATSTLPTITNAPSATQPKWIGISDGGVIRKVPTWL